VLIGGSVIIEFIFNIPGIGSYVLDAIRNRDYNAIMAVE
jgi:peptide/nickel transport system permease protein